MSKIRVRALQPLVDYKTGLHYAASDEFELERSEYEIVGALTSGLYEIVESPDVIGEDDGKVFSDRADS